MAAVLAGGIIVIWLALSGGRALLGALGVTLHRRAALAAPPGLALAESALFLLAVPAGELLPEPQRWPAAWALVALAWLINGAVSARLWRLHHRG
ncbi:MAG: hypothetical protein CL543_00245 [Alcanivorax sp.]|nr:hypothetical protein [Alcanivorax sp.]MAY09960.1 hypothetical protein [Alcanivorax sp.]MBI53143.1 hypothetical protein [Alcanivorax sp.]MBU57291.1 hypothetical protein [Alcanivorax sp.]|tara:strand:- start:31795 stop:32079 length:285 start_codon:yes stop_codon:yes gene_type:complete